MKIKRLGHILLHVKDAQRSKQFYRDILGFKILEEDPEHDNVVFMGVGENSHTVDLVPTPDGVAPSPEKNRLGFGHAAFAVDTEDDLKESYFSLVDAGVEVVRALDHENQQSIYFRDPDGNMLEIYWERPNAMELWKNRSDEDTEITFTRPT